MRINFLQGLDRTGRFVDCLHFAVASSSHSSPGIRREAELNGVPKADGASAGRSRNGLLHPRSGQGVAFKNGFSSSN